MNFFYTLCKHCIKYILFHLILSRCYLLQCTGSVIMNLHKTILAFFMGDIFTKITFRIVLIRILIGIFLQASRKKWPNVKIVNLKICVIIPILTLFFFQLAPCSYDISNVYYGIFIAKSNLYKDYENIFK